jgi:hypothetical protein
MEPAAQAGAVHQAGRDGAHLRAARAGSVEGVAGERALVELLGHR